jgi:hypothetical protein
MGRSRARWAGWDENDVAGWMKDNNLKKYAKVFVKNQITGEALPGCLEEKYFGSACRKSVLEEEGQCPLYIIEACVHLVTLSCVFDMTDNARYFQATCLKR